MCVRGERGFNLDKVWNGTGKKSEIKCGSIRGLTAYLQPKMQDNFQLFQKRGERYQIDTKNSKSFSTGFNKKKNAFTEDLKPNILRIVSGKCKPTFYFIYL